MPVVPSLIERLVLFGLKLGPAPVLDIVGATALPSVVTASRVGIFDALSAGSLTSAELAQLTGSRADRLVPFLEHLVSLGYVRHRLDRYDNSGLATMWLVSTSPRSIVPFLRFWQEVVIPHGWSDLGSFVRGGAALDLYGWLDAHPEHWPLAQDAFRAVARLEADSVARRIALPQQARFVDIGGGHGLYTVALLRRHREARAMIFDLERPLESARQTLGEVPEVSDRIELRSGDIFEGSPGSDFDAALLFNMIHGFAPDRARDLLIRARRTVRPGGRVFVLDQLAGGAPGPATRAVKSLLGLNYQLVLGGLAYRAEEVVGLLRDAGLTNTRRRRLVTSDLFEATLP